MNKVGVIILVIAALVFCGLGFLIGSTVEYSEKNYGTSADPVAQKSYVDTLVSNNIAVLQEEIDDLKAQIADLTAAIEGGNTGTGNPNGGNNTTTQSVKTTASVNVRATASTTGSVLTTVDTNTVLTYIGSTSGSDGTWYNVKLSDGTVGYVFSQYCSEPY